MKGMSRRSFVVGFVAGAASVPLALSPLAAFVRAQISGQGGDSEQVKKLVVMVKEGRHFPLFSAWKQTLAARAPMLKAVQLSSDTIDHQDLKPSSTNPLQVVDGWVVTEVELALLERIIR